MMLSIKTEPVDVLMGVTEENDGGQEPHWGPLSSFKDRSDLLVPAGAISKKRSGARVSTKGIKRPGYRRRIVAPFSYVDLIKNAIKSAPNCMLTLREILSHLEENNECFRGSYVGWKNSVRHNLSVNDCFVKLLRHSHRPFGKDNFWALNPDHSHPVSFMKTPPKLSPNTSSPFDDSTPASCTPPQTGDETARSSPQIIAHPPVVQSEPVDLRKRADPFEENSNRATGSPKPHESTRRIRTPTAIHRGNSLTLGNTLPISRFLNSPPLSRGDKSNERDTFCPVLTMSSATRRSSVSTPTSPRATVHQSTSPPSVDDAIVHRAAAEAAPHTPADEVMMKSLYEHYWNRALQERHALYCQHLAMLKGRHDRLGYQRSPSVCVPPTYPPVVYPTTLLPNNYMPYGYTPLTTIEGNYL